MKFSTTTPINSGSAVGHSKTERTLAFQAQCGYRPNHTIKAYGPRRYLSDDKIRELAIDMEDLDIKELLNSINIKNRYIMMIEEMEQAVAGILENPVIAEGVITHFQRAIP